MRIEDLRVFSVLAEARSLHRAAQKLGLTQSTVTKILQRLEAEFEVRLVDRGGRGVELTYAGRVLLERIADVRESVAQTYAEMSAVKSASAGRIRLGVVPALLESALLPMVARYTKREKEISFALSVQVSTLLFEELKDGQLDLALCFMPEAIPDELQSDDFGRQRYVIAARRGHPLASASVEPALLKSAQWLLPLPGHGMRQLVSKFFQEHGLGAPQVVIETDASTALLPSLLRDSDLITILTDQMLQTHAGRDLVALPYETAFETRMQLFYRRKAYMSPAVQKFRTALHSAMKPA
ncbi:LysR family transcriptional regulator [Cupriavidus sp. 2TAF22]|uniref:LysR family transcriptional regulator n=1 Tax=unclassified Cupriavidus TaxID=2640874 RepID=UPI003F8F2455